MKSILGMGNMGRGGNDERLALVAAAMMDV
jgi:hypothetical protein